VREGWREKEWGGEGRESSGKPNVSGTPQWPREGKCRCLLGDTPNTGPPTTFGTTPSTMGKGEDKSEGDKCGGGWAINGVERDRR